MRERLGALPEFQGSDAPTKFRLAEELAQRGDIQGAIHAYREAIHLKPDWADPYRGLGQVLLDHHDYAEAAEALQSSIRLGRDDHQAFYWLGRACMGKGELSAADAALVRATQLNPDDAESFADLGLVRMAQGDIAGADQAVTRAISLKPDRVRRRLLTNSSGGGSDTKFEAEVTPEHRIRLPPLDATLPDLAGRKSFGPKDTGRSPSRARAQHETTSSSSRAPRRLGQFPFSFATGHGGYPRSDEVAVR